MKKWRQIKITGSWSHEHTSTCFYFNFFFLLLQHGVKYNRASFLWSLIKKFKYFVFIFSIFSRKQVFKHIWVSNPKPKIHLVPHPFYTCIIHIGEVKRSLCLEVSNTEVYPSNSSKQATTSLLLQLLNAAIFVWRCRYDNNINENLLDPLPIKGCATNKKLLQIK